MPTANRSVQDPLKERFTRPPFIKYERGEDSGLVGFDRALTEEDIAFVKEKVKTLGGKTIEWTAAEGKLISNETPARRLIYISRVGRTRIPHRTCANRCEAGNLRRFSRRARRCARRSWGRERRERRAWWRTRWRTRWRRWAGRQSA
jgi:hypothetical protein